MVKNVLQYNFRIPCSNISTLLWRRELRSTCRAWEKIVLLQRQEDRVCLCAPKTEEAPNRTYAWEIYTSRHVSRALKYLP